jgi:phenylpyruvate tautomerase PptA (4-oxalocrotonate tautomerase family)
VPEGQYTEEARKKLVMDVTEAVVRAVGGSFEDVAPQVWVFPTEIPDGRWGSRGLIRRISDIHTFIVGDEQERKVGEQRLARSRRAQAAELLEGVLDSARKGSKAE